MENENDIFLGYCFDAEGRYPPPVHLHNVPQAFNYINFQRFLHPRVMITNDADECVMEARDGQFVFSKPDRRTSLSVSLDEAWLILTPNANLERGTKVVLTTKDGALVVGTITYRSVEQGKVIYDYTDEYGNCSWCYSDQIKAVI